MKWLILQFWFWKTTKKVNWSLQRLTLDDPIFPSVRHSYTNCDSAYKQQFLTTFWRIGPSYGGTSIFITSLFLFYVFPRPMRGALNASRIIMQDYIKEMWICSRKWLEPYVCMYVWHNSIQYRPTKEPDDSHFKKGTPFFSKLSYFFFMYSPVPCNDALNASCLTMQDFIKKRREYML